MTAESKRLWKRICREVLNKHPMHIKLLLDWRDAERRELLEACQAVAKRSAAGVPWDCNAINLVHRAIAIAEGRAT